MDDLDDEICPMDDLRNDTAPDVELQSHGSSTPQAYADADGVIRVL